MKKKRAAAERFVRLTYGMMQSQAWRSLDGNARAIYVEIAMRYCGTNNGQIGFSVREAARAIQVSTATAARAILQLQDRSTSLEVGNVPASMETLRVRATLAAALQEAAWRSMTNACAMLTF